jgi:hypothetical protein
MDIDEKYEQIGKIIDKIFVDKKVDTDRYESVCKEVDKFLD